MPWRSCARQFQCFVRTWHLQRCSEVLCAYQSKPWASVLEDTWEMNKVQLFLLALKSQVGHLPANCQTFLPSNPQETNSKFARAHSRGIFSDIWGLIKSWQAIPVSTSFAQITEPLRTSPRDAGLWGWCIHSCRLRWGNQNYSLWSNAPQVFFLFGFRTTL